MSWLVTNAPAKPAQGRGAHHHRRAGRARAQPQEHLGRDPARPAHRRHRALGLGQVEPGVRHDLRRRAAALHGVALELRQAVRRAGGQARRGLRVRPVAGDLDRAEDARQQPALDRRHDDRHRQLPEPALRDHRRAALPAHRRADAQPDVEPDPRGDPVAARRHRDRAARAGVQGLRRGAGLRLHRGAQEGLPPADHRRQAGGHLRRRSSSTNPTVTAHGRRRRSLRRRPQAREGDQGGDRRHAARRRRAAAGPRSSKGASKAEAERFYRGLCSATHHFVYGDIGPEYFMFNNPESACRTCGGLGVDKLTHPELLVPDPKRSIRRRLLRARGVQVQPGHLGRPGDVQPVEGARLLARHAVGGAAGEGARRDPLRHRAEEDRADVAARREGQARRLGRQGGRLRRHRAAHRAATTAATGSAARPTRGWRRGSTR